jgi:hypothetical protein
MNHSANPQPLECDGTGPTRRAVLALGGGIGLSAFLAACRDGGQPVAGRPGAALSPAVELVGGPPYVRITTTGATFNPTVELAAGSTATVSWMVENGTTVTGLNPTISFGTAATRHVRMSVHHGGTEALHEVITFNLGFDHRDDLGRYNMGASHDKPGQAVTRVENISGLTGLRRFAAARTNLSGSLDFTGCSRLQYIECIYSRVQSVTLTGCTSLIRLCVEENNLTDLNLNPVAANLRDLRAAGQHGASLTLVPLTAPLAALSHFCVRDQTVINHPLPAQLPVVQQRWDWNTNQSGVLTSTSTAIYSLLTQGNHYTSADLSGQFPRGRNATLDASSNKLTAVNLSGCYGLVEITFNNNRLSTAQVDRVLATVESWGTSGHRVDLSGNSRPSAAGVASAAKLTVRGWRVVTGSSPGVLADDFGRADATGIAKVGNGWFTPGQANANIAGGNLVRTDSASYQLFLNPARGVLPADYTVTASVPALTGSYWGLVGRWSSGTGVRVSFDSGGRTNLTVGDASGHDTAPVKVPTPHFPASWSKDGIDHTLALRMKGTQIEVICDGQVVTTCTVATNATATGTGYGCCGEGQNRVWQSIGTTTP